MPVIRAATKPRTPTTHTTPLGTAGIMEAAGEKTYQKFSVHIGGNNDNHSNHSCAGPALRRWWLLRLSEVVTTECAPRWRTAFTSSARPFRASRRSRSMRAATAQNMEHRCVVIVALGVLSAPVEPTCRDRAMALLRTSPNHEAPSR